MLIFEKQCCNANFLNFLCQYLDILKFQLLVFFSVCPSLFVFPAFLCGLGMFLKIFSIIRKQTGKSLKTCRSWCSGDSFLLPRYLQKFKAKATVYHKPSGLLQQKSIVSRFCRQKSETKVSAEPSSLWNQWGILPSFWWFAGNLWRSLACVFITPNLSFTLPSPCVSGFTWLSSYDTSHIGLWTHPLIYDLILTNHPCKDPISKLHHILDVPEVRSFFCRGGIQFNP